MYFNRELSWLKFNERVLREAEDKQMPILERLKFNAIFSSNLDEFFMVRVASVNDQIKLGYKTQDPSGRVPLEVFKDVNEAVSDLVEKQNEISTECSISLKNMGIEIIRKVDYTPEIVEELRHYFKWRIFPILTPMGVDFSRPFPLISNKSLYIAIKLMINNTVRLGLVQVPSVVNRLILLKDKSRIRYVLLEDVIETFISDLFIGYEILATGQFRITRNGDLNLIEEDADDLLVVIEEAIKLRKWGEAIRMELSAGVDKWIWNILMNAFHLNEYQVYEIKGILDKTLWFKFDPPLKKPNVKLKSYKPKKISGIKSSNIFAEIKAHDIFLHHPYERFDYVVEFIKTASKDPRVLAIKQTLYRVSGDSAIVKALLEAAERGKQVTVLVELMARFDEENNINWAKKLEQKGVHVIYGIYGLKTHSKITLIVRKDQYKLRRYIHLGTGNYNDQTAKIYTDMGLLTCDNQIGLDASIFFNMVSGFSSTIETKSLTVAPYHMRQKFYDLIDREINIAKRGKKAVIYAKMNSLVDLGIIDKLYEASNAGVEIKLIIRGICTLIPGVKGYSENIEVKSIVGVFLEHSRIFYFYNRGKEEIYLSSADWMTRNLDRRIELLFPIKDPTIKTRILEILKLYLADNQKSWKLCEDGNYYRVPVKDQPKIQAQMILRELEYNDNTTFIEQIKMKNTLYPQKKESD